MLTPKTHIELLALVNEIWGEDTLSLASTWKVITQKTHPDRLRDVSLSSDKTADLNRLYKFATSVLKESSIDSLNEDMIFLILSAPPTMIGPIIAKFSVKQHQQMTHVIASLSQDKACADAIAKGVELYQKMQPRQQSQSTHYAQFEDFKGKQPPTNIRTQDEINYVYNLIFTLNNDDFLKVLRLLVDSGTQFLLVPLIEQKQTPGTWLESCFQHSRYQYLKAMTEMLINKAPLIPLNTSFEKQLFILSLLAFGPGEQRIDLLEGNCHYYEDILKECQVMPLFTDPGIADHIAALSDDINNAKTRQNNLLEEIDAFMKEYPIDNQVEYKKTFLLQFNNYRKFSALHSDGLSRQQFSQINDYALYTTENSDRP